ncbi:MAG: nitrate reductase molybdenum cofactor assembly chaperone [Streptococcaceae bacterium]|nr:nitrate reductase molybdenum cofactor assembly chaperone [Streptococcaceae bacterium]
MREILENEFRARQAAFGALSALIDFPQHGILPAHFKAWPEIAALAAELSLSADIDLKIRWTQLFENNKKLTLYMTYYKLTDSRARGQVLAKLKLLYEEFGILLAQAELTDYLPAMLEFLSVITLDEATAENLADLQLLFSVLEDGTFEALKRAENPREPYIRLIARTRDLLKECLTIEKEEINS